MPVLCPGQPGGVFLIEDFCLRRRPLVREGQWEQEAVILEQGIQVWHQGRGQDGRAVERRGRRRDSLNNLSEFDGCVGAGWGGSADARGVRGTTEGRGATRRGEEGGQPIVVDDRGGIYVYRYKGQGDTRGGWQLEGHLRGKGGRVVCNGLSLVSDNQI